MNEPASILSITVWIFNDIDNDNNNNNNNNNNIDEGEPKSCAPGLLVAG